MISEQKLSGLISHLLAVHNATGNDFNGLLTTVDVLKEYRQLRRALQWNNFSWECVPEHGRTFEIRINGQILRGICDIRWARSDSVPEGAQWRYPIDDVGGDKSTFNEEL